MKNKSCRPSHCPLQHMSVYTRIYVCACTNLMGTNKEKKTHCLKTKKWLCLLRIIARNARRDIVMLFALEQRTAWQKDSRVPWESTGGYMPQRWKLYVCTTQTRIKHTLCICHNTRFHQSYFLLTEVCMLIVKFQAIQKCINKIISGFFSLIAPLWRKPMPIFW